jgi:O-methyltransferase
MKRLLRRLLGRDGEPTAALRQDFTPEHRAMVEYARPYSMTSPERIVHLVEAVRYIHANGIPGDVVECGVWRGGSMMVVARLLVQLGDTSRDLYLFDTFEGMPAPSAGDRDFGGTPAQELLGKESRTRDSLVWAYAPVEEVAANMRSTGYPAERVHLVQGRIEETVPSRAPDAIALLRLDTDWYESTRHELTHLYHRLAPRGVLIIDDYGWWQGARQAVDEFFLAQPFKPLLSRIDCTGRSLIKG